MTSPARTPARRWLRRVLVIILIAVWGPYLWSRIASTWRCVSVVTAPSTGMPAASDPEPDRLRIAVWNIAHGAGTVASFWKGGPPQRRLDRLDRIAEQLRAMDADVVVLNEIDFDATWSHGVNQARYLADKAGYRYRVQERNYDFRVLWWTWRFGNAVLSRHPIRAANVLELPGTPAWQRITVGGKRAVACDIDLGGRTVRVVAAHLSHLDEGIRVESASTLIEAADASPWPVLVAGDLNSTAPGLPDAAVDEAGNNTLALLDGSGLFRRAFEDTAPRPADLTFRSANPMRVIDWILIPRGWRFGAYAAVPSLLSDHRAVRADVIMARAEGVSR